MEDLYFYCPFIIKKTLRYRAGFFCVLLIIVVIQVVLFSKHAEDVIQRAAVFIFVQQTGNDSHNSAA